MFPDYLKALSIERLVSECLMAKSYQIEQLLKKPRLTVSDLPFLLSPNATPYLEKMAQRAQAITVQRFGRTMQLFIPLYVSNECFNVCTYCGFSKEHAYKRITLNDTQIIEEAKILKSKGFDHILLLTGESPKKVGVDYISHAVKLLSPLFSSVGIEVQPMKQADYERMIQSGCDSLTLYQETYHYDTYKTVHLSGIKSRYKNRLLAVEEGAKAGFYRINLGILMGLYDWHYDALCLAHHIDYMQRYYWRSKMAVSFPRIKDMVGEFIVNYPISDVDLVQVMIAFRCVFPDIGMTLSTREPADLRNELLSLGVTSMSAESSTAPGGYNTCLDAEQQFEVSDKRDINQIKQLLQNKGYDPVSKDWDTVFIGQ